MLSVQVSKPKGPFEIVEREIPEPSTRHVRIKVQACGICHSDSLMKDGLFPGIQYPRVPGHEIAGVIDAIGKDVNEWKTGRGDFVTCTYAQIPGFTYDGGYADYMIAPTEALASIPDELSAPEAAPMMCAGITTFNALRNSGARVGDAVAIIGVGGLGHLAIQFASKMGFKTIAIARGKDKEELVKKLGARHYIDSKSQDPVEELVKLGGAKIILGTVPSGKAMSSVLGGLAVNGKLIMIGASDEPLEVSPKNTSTIKSFTGTRLNSR